MRTRVLRNSNRPTTRPFAAHLRPNDVVHIARSARTGVRSFASACISRAFGARERTFVLVHGVKICNAGAAMFPARPGDRQMRNLSGTKLRAWSVVAVALLPSLVALYGCGASTPEEEVARPSPAATQGADTTAPSTPSGLSA